MPALLQLLFDHTNPSFKHLGVLDPKEGGTHKPSGTGSIGNHRRRIIDRPISIGIRDVLSNFFLTGKKPTRELDLGTVLDDQIFLYSHDHATDRLPLIYPTTQFNALVGESRTN